MDSDLLGFLFSTYFYLFVLVAQRVERFLVSVLHAYLHRAGNYTCLLSNTALLLSIDSKLLGLFQHHSICCDSEPLHLFQSSHFWRQNFEVSDLCFSSPSFLISGNRASISSDEFPCHTNSNTVSSWSDSRILNLYKLSKTSSGGILVIDNRISSHVVSNFWTSSLRRVIVNRST